MVHRNYIHDRPKPVEFVARAYRDERSELTPALDQTPERQRSHGVLPQLNGGLPEAGDDAIARDAQEVLVEVRRNNDIRVERDGRTRDRALRLRLGLGAEKEHVGSGSSEARDDLAGAQPPKVSPPLARRWADHQDLPLGAISSPCLATCPNGIVKLEAGQEERTVS